MIILGGIKGFSQSDDLVAKWTLTSHLRSAISTNMKKLLSISGAGATHKDFGLQSIKKSQEAVSKITDIISNKMDPFQFDLATDQNERYPLVNIYNGVVLPDVIADELLDAKNIGLTEVEKFINERLKSDNRQHFWNKMSKCNIPTFISSNKSIKCNVNSTSKSIKIDRELFQRMLVISQARDIDISQVLTYELSSIPLSITYMNGDMRKSQKSVLLKELEIDSETIVERPAFAKNKTCEIVDLMGLVHLIRKDDCKTFNDVCNKLAEPLEKILTHCNMLVVVPDRYDIQHSIKSFERNRRGSVLSRVQIIKDGTTPFPHNIKKYLSNSENKTNLVNFFLKYLISKFMKELKEFQTVFIGNLDG